MKSTIGNVKFENPFFLAPLAGITDSSFRRLCKEQGAGLVYTEMISAKGLYYNDKATERLLAHEKKELPIGVQLFGSDPSIMAFAVDKLSDRDFCLVDVNMGCPVPKVVKNGEGSALMKNPKLAASIVKAMVQAEREAARKNGRNPKPVTVKCRIGWDSTTINLREFALAIQEAGAAAIAVHGRTREQYYSGKADWIKIAEVKDQLSIPVIGSGDVFTAEDASRMRKETGCDFVMIARGALGNPWIFRDALALYEGQPLPPPPTLAERADMLARQLSMLVAEKGEGQAVREMRKHVGWTLKGVPHSAEIRRRVNNISKEEELKALFAGIRSSVL